LADIQRRLEYHARLLKDIEGKGLAKARTLLEGAQAFVREALVSQRKARRGIEREVVRAIQREALGPTKGEKARTESIPNDLVALLDAYGLLDSAELRRFLQFIDDGILRVHLDQDTYTNAIRELREYLEENL